MAKLLYIFTCTLVFCFTLFCVRIRAQHICDTHNNHYHPHWDGTCPEYTVWDPEIGCCVRCGICGPGFQLAPGCEGKCLPCEDGYYSDKTHNDECIPCTNCEEQHRTLERKCLETQDTKCGDCFKGYFFHPGGGSVCLKCFDGVTDKWCQSPKVTSKRDHIPGTFGYDNHNRFGPTFSAVIVFGVIIVFMLFLIILMVARSNSMRRSRSRITDTDWTEMKHKEQTESLSNKDKYPVSDEEDESGENRDAKGDPFPDIEEPYQN